MAVVVGRGGRVVMCRREAVVMVVRESGRGEWKRSSSLDV